MRTGFEYACFLTNTDDAMEGVGENGNNEESAGYQEDLPMPYNPQAPPRTEAPAVFKAWRQETNGAMMTQVNGLHTVILSGK